MREIVLDTETTGLDPKQGDRIVEIGCIELLNRIPTGREYHCYINPERDMPAKAEEVHGLSAAFLKDKPVFRSVAQDFLSFIGDAHLVIHNAQFDVGFLNSELERLGHAHIGMQRVVDTLALAKRKHPAGPNSLDGLCRRYNIDNTIREKHGALIDCKLLADVYIELLGDRQAAFGLQSSQRFAAGAGARTARVSKQRHTPLPPRISPDALAQHQSYIQAMIKSAVWLQFWRTNSGTKTQQGA